MARRSSSSRQPKADAAATSAAKNATGSTSSSALTWMILAAILALTVVTYLPVFDGAKEFTNWDDGAYVTEQPLVRSLDAENIKQMFKTESRVAANYHPLTMLSLAVDYSRGEGQMWAFMQTTLLLHLVNSALVFAFVMMLLHGNLIAAALSAALFAIHPMHVESVDWVAERKDVLYTACYLASLIAYVRYVRGGSLMWFIGVFASFVLSCLAKPMAVTLPVVLVLIDLLEKRRVSVGSALEKIPFFIVAIIFGVLTLQVQSSEGAGLVDTTYFSFGERVLFALYGIAEYVGRLFVPIQLSAFYPYPSTDGQPEGIVYPLAALALTGMGLVVWLWRKNRTEFTDGIFFGAAFFVVTISIVLQLISVGGAVIADRYTYVPYVGLFIVLGILLERATKSKAPYLALGIIAACSIVYAGMSNARIEVWQNSGTLWEDVIAKHGKRMISHAYNNRAVYNMGKGNLEAAERDYAFLERLGTKKSYTYKGYGALLQKLNRDAEAIPRFTKALQYGAPDVQVYRARGLAYSRIQKHDSAIADLRTAFTMRPDDLDAAMTLLSEYLDAQRPQDALVHGGTIAPMCASIPQYHIMMGAANGMLGKHEAAYKAFSRALELDPKNESARRNMEVAKSQF
ncbi:MAG: hypothetical protein ACKOE4_05335 [Candidatus Kapaibacterium sp.]